MTSMLKSSEGTKIQTDDRDHNCGLYYPRSQCMRSICRHYHFHSHCVVCFIQKYIAISTIRVKFTSKGKINNHVEKDICVYLIGQLVLLLFYLLVAM